jgi:hypothetical protein
MLFSTSCGYDATPLYQQVRGTWKLVAVDDLIGDAIPERLPGEDVTLILTAQATYTQTFSVGNSTYSGIYTISDPTHITFTEQRTPTNISRPPYTVEFRIQNDKLILSDISRETYQRRGP